MLVLAFVLMLVVMFVLILVLVAKELNAWVYL